MPRLTRWSNSMGRLRLPKSIIAGAGLKVGDELTCRLLDSGEILISPTKTRAAIDQKRLKALAKSDTDQW